MYEVSDFFLLAGLYAVDFLVVVLAVLTSVDIIAGEIASGTIHTIVTKPLRRWEIVMGKWLGLSLMLSLFTIVMSLGIMLAVWVISGYRPQNPAPGVLLIALEGMIILSVSILGGTRLSTLNNGVLVFGLYGLAFIGAWVEQFGAFLSNQTAVNIGIVISLLMPAEAMWKLAAYQLQPPVMRLLAVHPLAAVNPPSTAMVVYSFVYIGVVLAGALVLFERRDL
jgi:ABC-type transport system involved in multi-copper enzyme maturation permease subunit